MLCVALLPGIVVGATLVDGPSVEAISGTNALVRWATDVATGGRVRYGTELSNLTQGAESAQGIPAHNFGAPGAPTTVLKKPRRVTCCAP